MWMGAHHITDIEAAVAQKASPMLIAYWLDVSLGEVERDPRGSVKRAATTLWMQLQRTEMRETFNVIQVDDPKNPPKKRG